MKQVGHDIEHKFRSHKRVGVVETIKIYCLSFNVKSFVAQYTKRTSTSRINAAQERGENQHYGKKYPHTSRTIMGKFCLEKCFSLQTSFLLCQTPLALDDCGSRGEQLKSVLQKDCACALALSDRLETFALRSAVFLFFASSSLPQKQIKFWISPYQQAFLWGKNEKINEAEALLEKINILN